MSGEQVGKGSVPEKQTPRILVVDDDHRNVRLMESILKANGYEVLRAYDGKEALQVVGTDAPDLLLLDVMMPRMNGLEVCQRLRANRATRLLPIIMVTALNALDDRVEALEQGADDFVSKPINKIALLAKVRSILRVKSLQDELERTNEQLVRMQRFKESMTQMVVHDMKNPLSGIMGNVQLIQIQKDNLDSVRLAELLQRTQESASQLMRMILNLLHIGRLEENKMPLRPVRLPLRDIVQENVQELTSVSLRERITVENRVDADLPEPRGDRELVGRVIGNLLSNALKHTPEDGRVVLDATQAADEIVLSVMDTGEGIPEDLQPHVFEKFMAGSLDSARSPGHDSGLGLTFCRLAVEAHGGRIWIQSRPGEGTTVFVALPMKPVLSDARTDKEHNVAGGGRSAA